MPAKAPATDAATLTLLTELGAAFRARRKALGVQVLAAAEAAGMSRVTWYRLEKGEPTVTLGAWANAARVLGLAWPTPPADPAAPAAPRPGEWIPVEIRIDEYPQLRRLAWQVVGRPTVAPREAWAIYERNTRDLDVPGLAAHERDLVMALRRVFGTPDV
jgi:transcriptional regulator with XRE-family HTH domain